MFPYELLGNETKSFAQMQYFNYVLKSAVHLCRVFVRLFVTDGNLSVMRLAMHPPRCRTVKVTATKATVYKHC